MLLRIAAFGLMLIASPIVSAQETFPKRSPLIPLQAIPSPGPDSPKAFLVQAGEGVAGNQAREAKRDGQRQLLEQKCAEIDRLQREIAQLRAATGTAKQILVKVQMVEVSLTKIRQLGIDTHWFKTGIDGGPKIRTLLDELRGRVETPAAEAVQADCNEILAFVDGLRNNGLAKVLSEPTLITVSGRPASFHTGGQIPLPRKDGSDAVEFQSFGTQLEVQALALGGDQVRLEVSSKVSELDDSRGIEIDGVRIPGLTVRHCNTGVELSFGQTAVVTGLLERRKETRKDDQGQDEEVFVDMGLMMVVTPELIAPPKTPTASANLERTVPIQR